MLVAGRSGMAFSFFTRDELPYLLDLHLLLSCTLTPAPAVPQPQAADAPSSLSASNSVYGMVPQVRSEPAGSHDGAASLMLDVQGESS